MANSSLLLKGGIVLTHGPNDAVQVHRNTDVLVNGDQIAEIGPNISAPLGAKILDCTGKLLSPGFVDTHHHVWQTQLKGRHANHTLLEYLVPGNMQSANYTPKDILWGELGGCLEAIDGGTTTIFDHAHMNYSPEHTDAAISATVSSGIRSLFGYCPTMIVKQFNPKLVAEENLLPDWLMEKLKSLAEQAPFGDGRVQLAFAFDGLFLPKEIVQNLFKSVREIGIRNITLHYVPGPLMGRSSIVDMLESYDLLGPDILLSHATEAPDSDGLKLEKAGAHVSATPGTELQMAHGQHVAFRPAFSEVSSWGIDCHSSNSSEIVGQMRLGLQVARAFRSDEFIRKGTFPLKLEYTVEQAYNIGTIKGARALRMEEKIGSLAVGKLADIVVFDAMSPGMCCAVEEDPVAAIVLHSSIRDIETVIIGGKIKKENGKLVTTNMEAQFVEDGAKQEMEWSDVAKELVRSREEIEVRMKGIDYAAVTEDWLNMMHVDKTKFVEP